MRTLITVAAALALLVGSQAFGAVSIEYKLELGGNNHADQFHALTPAYPVYTRGSDADGATFSNTGKPDGAVADWAVVVHLIGVDDLSGYYAAGAANLVFDLELRDSTGTLVAVGHGSPTTAGFFSTINNGVADADGRPNYLQDAAFTSVFNIDGKGGLGGRVFDKAGDGGPGLTFKTYPSDAGHPAASTAGQGLLVGMGAGYESLTSGVMATLALASVSTLLILRGWVASAPLWASRPCSKARSTSRVCPTALTPSP